MDTNRPRLLFLLVLSAALGLAGAACGSADDSVVASVGSATLSQAEFEAILVGNGVEDTSVVSNEVASGHIGEWIFFESWIDLLAEDGTVKGPWKRRGFKIQPCEHDETESEATAAIALTSEQITSFVLDGSGAELQGLQANLYERGISVDPRFGVFFDPTLGLVGPAIAETDPGSSDAAGVDSAQADTQQS